MNPKQAVFSVPTAILTKLKNKFSKNKMKRNDFKKRKTSVRYVRKNLKKQTKISQSGNGRWVQEVFYVKNVMKIKELNLRKR